MVWRVLKRRSASVAFRDYREMLDQAANCLPKGVKVVLLADRGFVQTDLMATIAIHTQSLFKDFILFTGACEAISALDQAPPLELLPLDCFKQRQEIAFPKPLSLLATFDQLKEKGGFFKDRPGKGLQ